jgi:hypothetical protein
VVTSDEEVRKRMLVDREAWRSRSKMIVAADKKGDTTIREDRSEMTIFMN